MSGFDRNLKKMLEYTIDIFVNYARRIKKKFSY